MASTVTVKPGDTLSAIASKAGISLASLLKANPQITNPNLIKPGQKITIPVPTKATATPVKTTTAAPAGGTDSQNAAKIAAEEKAKAYALSPAGIRAGNDAYNAAIASGATPAQAAAASSAAITTGASGTPLPAGSASVSKATVTPVPTGGATPVPPVGVTSVSTSSTPSPLGTFGYSVPGFALPNATSTSDTTAASEPYGGFGWSVPGGVGPNATGTGSLSATENPKAPGKAWIWNGTEWVKPAKPFIDKNYTWNDETGWTEVTVGGGGSTTTTTTDTGSSERQSIVTILTDRFNKYGLSSLANRIKELAIDGATEATITIALQETEEYQIRFSANKDRVSKGLRVLTPAEYLNLEDGYRQILRSYGLKQFDNDPYVKQFIANDVSASELSDRVVTAVQRVQNADPAVAKTLKDYYGISSADMVGYVLDPNQQLQKIQRQVAAAEIGTAARRQGLESGVTVAEQLAAQGISEAEAQKGYSTIADILPTAEKLSAIYGTTMQGYGQSEAEQEVFNSLASAQRKRTALSQREIAAFSGSSGLSNKSLTSESKGQL